MHTAKTTKWIARIGALGVAAALVSSDRLGAQEGLRTYTVQVTNLTRGQQLTPRLVVVHSRDLQIFTLGQAARPELAALAEQGDTAPLSAALAATKGVLRVATVGGLLPAGGTEEFTVTGRPGLLLTVASMLIPTNDGFFAVRNLVLPYRSETAVSPVYDSGSERNDELCLSIPGPFFVECGGPGGGAVVGEGEGFVHIHAGMHGVGNLREAERDWRNPAVQIVVTQVR